ncbi:uncharacterized protein LOC129715962 isoform X2 [Leucoraja erinacea]|uniref:uncharacterized protein LOC129715962 isoform X2 n=1 Tax=Leucoraja erinaceus TaxID=7782 RepID=UPI002454E85E|nr:uncharacterized protein LOC129715962 isoform X2 [Leucoraja erinacea]
MDSDDEMRDTFDEHDIGDQNGACGRQMGQENRDYVHQGGAQALENSYLGSSFDVSDVSSSAGSSGAQTPQTCGLLTSQGAQDLNYHDFVNDQQRSTRTRQSTPKKSPQGFPNNAASLPSMYFNPAPSCPGFSNDQPGLTSSFFDATPPNDVASLPSMYFNPAPSSPDCFGATYDVSDASSSACSSGAQTPQLCPLPSAQACGIPDDDEYSSVFLDEKSHASACGIPNTDMSDSSLHLDNLYRHAQQPARRIPNPDILDSSLHLDNLYGSGGRPARRMPNQDILDSSLHLDNLYGSGGRPARRMPNQDILDSSLHLDNLYGSGGRPAHQPACRIPNPDILDSSLHLDNLYGSGGRPAHQPARRIPNPDILDSSLHLDTLYGSGGRPAHQPARRIPNQDILDSSLHLDNLYGSGGRPVHQPACGIPMSDMSDSSLHLDTLFGSGGRPAHQPARRIPNPDILDSSLHLDTLYGSGGRPAHQPARRIPNPDILDSSLHLDTLYGSGGRPGHQPAPRIRNQDILDSSMYLDNLFDTDGSSDYRGTSSDGYARIPPGGITQATCAPPKAGGAQAVDTGYQTWQDFLHGSDNGDALTDQPMNLLNQSLPLKGNTATKSKRRFSVDYSSQPMVQKTGAAAAASSQPMKLALNVGGSKRFKAADLDSCPLDIFSRPVTSKPASLPQGSSTLSTYAPNQQMRNKVRRTLDFTSPFKSISAGRSSFAGPFGQGSGAPAAASSQPMHLPSNICASAPAAASSQPMHLPSNICASAPAAASSQPMNLPSSMGARPKLRNAVQQGNVASQGLPIKAQHPLGSNANRPPGGPPPNRPTDRNMKISQAAAAATGQGACSQHIPPALAATGQGAGSHRVPQAQGATGPGAGSHHVSQAPTSTGQDTELEKAYHVIGEIAFQLDRRILSYIFVDQHRLYGFRVGEIDGRISEINRTGSQGGAMQARNNEIMDILQTYGYSPINHAELSELIVNTFGILSEKPPCQQTLDNYNNRDYLHKLIVDYAPPNFVNDLLVFLNSLWHLSVADGKPMFLW